MTGDAVPDADDLRLPPGCSFHHLGYATRSIARERAVFTTLGYRQEGEDFADPRQGVAGCFLTGPGPRIELLENLPGSDTLTPWLGQGARFYHLAYLVDRVADAVAWATAEGARVIVAPVPAVAFGGRPIAFVVFRNLLVLELIERPAGSPTPPSGADHG